MTSAFFGSLRIITSASFIEILKSRQNRKASDKFRNQAEFQQIFRFDVAEQLTCRPVFRRIDSRRESDRCLAAAIGNDLVQTGKGTAGNEQNICRVNLQETPAAGVLRPPCGGEPKQQCLP